MPARHGPPRSARRWNGPRPMSVMHRYQTPYYNYIQPWQPIINYTDPYEPVREPPMHWIGKYFVRQGYLPPNGVQPNQLIFENSIYEQHQVVGPNDMSTGYNPGRLLIYLNRGNRIENVRYG